MSNLPITGIWNGYLEGVSAQPPWDSLRLVILGASEAGGVCGTMTIGTGTLPAPATDPDVGYPPGVTGYLDPPLIPGFTFTLIKGTVVDGRVRFGISKREPWRGWCDLQTPYPSVGHYNCVPDALGGVYGSGGGGCYLNGPNGEHLVFDCGKLMLCGTEHVCVCNSTHCGGDPEAYAGDYFDLHFDTASADGEALYNVRARFFRSE